MACGSVSCGLVVHNGISTLFFVYTLFAETKVVWLLLDTYFTHLFFVDDMGTVHFFASIERIKGSNGFEFIFQIPDGYDNKYFVKKCGLLGFFLHFEDV